MNTIKHIVRTSPVFREEGRDANQKWILLSLLHQGGTCTYKKIEKKYLIEQTVVVRQMRKLAAKGLIGKSMSGRDKRVKDAWHHYAVLVKARKRAAAHYSSVQKSSSNVFPRTLHIFIHKLIVGL